MHHVISKCKFYYLYFADGTGTANYDFITANTIIAPHKKPRNGRKAIPDDQKDEQYFQKRKRNNQAAKRSRDARKIREDHVR